ncbi:MAG: T9SS type A sorting domain-containing protein [Flavobacterium sp.]
MRTKLLSIIAVMALSSGIASAQKTWDFGNDHTTWPLIGGYANNTVVDNLGMFANESGSITNFGATTANNASFSDGYTATYRFQTNGAGFTSSTGFVNTPVQRFVHFDVSGNCTVKVWFRSGSASSARTAYVTDGTATLGSVTTTTETGGDYGIVTAANTGGPKKIYVFGDQSINIYKIQVIGATVASPAPIVLANEQFTALNAIKVFANQKQVSVANVTEATKVDVYSLTGALVKSFSTEEDTNFDLSATGLYIVNLSSGNGRKSVKVLMQ